MVKFYVVIALLLGSVNTSYAVQNVTLTTKTDFTSEGITQSNNNGTVSTSQNISAIPEPSSRIDVPESTQVPSTLKSQVYENGTIDLFWPWAQDSLVYNIYANDQLIGSANDHSFLLTDLSPATEYTFSVHAYTTNGSPTRPATLTLTTPSLNEPTPEGINVAPTAQVPSSLNAVVYSDFQIGLHWPWAQDGLKYNVFINGQLADTTTDHFFLFDNFEPATEYLLSVSTTRLDGSATLPATLSITTGGLPNSTTYGKPSTDQNTFGFERWDDIQLQSLFPSDCLFLLEDAPIQTASANSVSSTVCYSPSHRWLMNALTKACRKCGNPIRWAYALPGNNETNNIEALVDTLGGEFVLVADVTTTFAQSSYEISRFNRLQGNFIETNPILEGVLFSSGDQQRQINLDGADLMVDLGPTTEFSNGESIRDIRVVGDYYEPKQSGDLSQLSGWVKVGAFEVIVDTRTGTSLKESYFPGRTAKAIF